MATAHQTPDLPGILRLSPETRRRIYIDVGLGPRCSQLWYGRPRTYNLGEQYYEPPEGTSGEKRHPKGFFGLLVCCRTIHAEAAAVLYASKRFVVRWDTVQSLAPLRALTPVAISSLTSLKVVLNQSSCHDRLFDSDDYGWCCYRRSRYGIYVGLDNTGGNTGVSGGDLRAGCYADFDCKHQPPLRGSDPDDLARLAEWQATAAQLAPHINPGKLELSLVCDFDPMDSEVAKLAVDALRSFPKLKDCHVKLSRNPNPQLRQLAEEAVLRGRGILSRSLSPDPSRSSTLAPVSSSLLALPQELRLQILEYTDLIAPVKEVMWATTHGMYMASRLSCLSWDARIDVGDCKRHGECRFTSCSAMEWPNGTIGCFCSRLHAAASSTCSCWAPPTPLFLICRILNEDAKRVFFSGNRFVVIDGKPSALGPPQPSNFRYGRLAASRFLKDVVPLRCLGYLRFLELVFPPYTPGSWPQPDGAVLRDWRETVDWVRDKINAPALTLRLTARYHSDEGQEDIDDTLTSAEAKETMEAYFRILKPLGCLGREDGLARFTADLTWPWERTESMRQKLYHSWTWDESRAWLRSRKRWLNERAERAVLGDRYECQRLRAVGPERGEWIGIIARDY